MADKKLIIPTGGGVKILLHDNGDGSYSIGTYGAGGGGGGGAVTIANGADVTQGAIADAAYSSGSGTIVSILKGIFGKTNTIDSAQGTVSDAAYSGTGNGTEISIAKRIAQFVTAIGAIGDAAWSSGNGTVIAVLKAISGSNTTIAGSVATSRMNTRLQRDGVATALTIASSASDSNALDVSGWMAGIFVIPSAFTGTAVSFKVSQTSTGHQPLYDQYGNQVSTPVAANRAFPLPQEAAGANSIIITSNATEAAARTINTFKKA